MIKGIGIDIVNVNRIKEVLSRWGDKFLKRVFSLNEIDYCLKKTYPHQHLAARFAAKEAFLKALGTSLDKGISLKDIEVKIDKNGVPFLNLSINKQYKPFKNIFLSISHEREFAVAIVILGEDNVFGNS